MDRNPYKSHKHPHHSDNKGHVRFFFLEHAGELRIISLKGEENVVHTPPKKLEKLIT
jgi:hypothetical protein